MKKIICTIFFVVIIFPWVVTAAELYIWTNEQGVTCITDTPPATQEPARKMTYKKDSPAEIEKWERERRANIKKQEAIQRVNEAREKLRLENQAKAEARASEARRTQAKIQEQRNRRAERLEKAVDNVLRSSGSIPHADKFREAAALKAQQIREGTDVPMSAAEDIRFHTEQAIQNEIDWHNLTEHR